MRTSFKFEFFTTLAGSLKFREVIDNVFLALIQFLGV